MPAAHRPTGSAGCHAIALDRGAFFCRLALHPVLRVSVGAVGELARPKTTAPGAAGTSGRIRVAWVYVPPPAFGDNVIGLRGLIIHDLGRKEGGSRRNMAAPQVSAGNTADIAIALGSALLSSARSLFAHAKAAAAAGLFPVDAAAGAGSRLRQKNSPPVTDFAIRALA